MVVGENQKFAAALIIPDFNHLKSWCKIKGHTYTTDEEMVNNPIIRQRINRVIDKANTNFGNSEQIKKFEILSKEWSTPGGELTPTLKLKRSYISQKYSSLIEKMFTNNTIKV